MSLEKNKEEHDLKFTGERLIPELNKGAAFFYEHLARYLFAIQFSKNKSVVDAGCGVGYGSYILSEYGGAKEVFGLDISNESITYASGKYSSNKIKFNVDDVEKLQTIPNGKIDFLVSFELIEHLNNQELYIDNVKRVLKKDGVFLVSSPNKLTYPEGNQFHKNELLPEEFENLLKKKFKNVVILYQDFSLAQVIKSKSNSTFELEEKFNIVNQVSYQTDSKIEESQYLIALCSDYLLPKYETITITSNKVDFFDLSRGILSLTDQFLDMRNISTQLQEQKNSTVKVIQEKLNYFNKYWESKDPYLKVSLQNFIPKTRHYVSEDLHFIEFVESLKKMIDDNKILSDTIIQKDNYIKEKNIDFDKNIEELKNEITELKNQIKKFENLYFIRIVNKIRDLLSRK